MARINEPRNYISHFVWLKAEAEEPEAHNLSIGESREENFPYLTYCQFESDLTNRVWVPFCMQQLNLFLSLFTSSLEYCAAIWCVIYCNIKTVLIQFHEF